MVAWEGPDGDQQGIWARRFGPSGPLGDEFRVNASTTGTPRRSRHRSCGDDGSGFGVAARFGCLAGDANASGSGDVADVFYLIDDLFAGGPAPV